MRLTYAFDVLLMYLNYAALIAAGVYSGVTGRWLALAIAVVCITFTLTLRIILVKKKCRLFGERISAWAIPFYELSLVWFDMLTKLRYMRADKHDFSTHKI